jgi:hypothetical protein
MERAALRCLTQSGGQIFAVRLFDGERVHEQFESFIRGGNVEQKLQNAFIDFERRVKQRTRPNFKEAPVAERPQAADAEGASGWAAAQAAAKRGSSAAPAQSSRMSTSKLLSENISRNRSMGFQRAGKNGSS